MQATQSKGEQINMAVVKTNYQQKTTKKTIQEETWKLGEGVIKIKKTYNKIQILPFQMESKQLTTCTMKGINRSKLQVNT